MASRHLAVDRWRDYSQSAEARIRVEEDEDEGGADHKGTAD
jgi:hypothetical protein